MMSSNKEGMGTIVIKLHYPTEDEYNKLKAYLDYKHWDYEDTSEFKRRKMDGKIKSE